MEESDLGPGVEGWGQAECWDENSLVFTSTGCHVGCASDKSL